MTHGMNIYCVVYKGDYGRMGCYRLTLDENPEVLIWPQDDNKLKEDAKMIYVTNLVRLMHPYGEQFSDYVAYLQWFNKRWHLEWQAKWE